MKKRQLIIPLILFVIGIILTIIGALFKIQHWPFGSEILTIGSFIEVSGLVVLLVILLKYYFKK